MAGRHRKKSTGWKAPVGLGVSVATGIAATFWLVGGQEQPTENATAAFMISPKTTTTPSTTVEPIAPVTTTTTTTTPPAAPPPPPAPKPTVAKSTAAKPAPPKASCGTSLDGVQPHVAQVGNHIKAKFGVTDIGGRAGRGGASDHPSGLALDFMVDTAKGNAIADYILANRKAFGVTYVIWHQRYNDGGGWSAMENRGSATANHFDHVHVSFRSGASVSVTC